MSDLILAADSHLNAEDRDTDRFLRFLRREGRTAGTLILVGDIFDLWIARDGLELPFHRLVIEALSELREEGVKVQYVQGNRDYFVAERYAEGPFDSVADESLLVLHGGRSIHVAHGDLINVRDRQYRRWRRATRSGWARSLFGLVPSPAAVRLCSYVERRLRTTNVRFRMGFPEDQAAEYARRVFSSGPDTIVLGHFHEARVMEFGSEVTI